MTFRIDIHNDDDIHEFLIENLELMGWKIDVNAKTGNSNWTLMPNQTSRFFELDLETKRISWIGGEYDSKSNENERWDSIGSDEEAIFFIDFIKQNFDSLVSNPKLPKTFSLVDFNWNQAYQSSHKDLEDALLLATHMQAPILTSSQSPSYDDWMTANNADSLYHKHKSVGAYHTNYGLDNHMEETFKKKQ